MRQPIRNISNESPYPTRLFDVVIDDEHPDEVYIEQKHNRRTERVSWADIQFQVNRAIQQSRSDTARKLPQQAP